MNTIEMKELEAARNATRDSFNADRVADAAVTNYDAALNANIGVQAACVAAREATNAAIKAASAARVAVAAYDIALDAA